MFGWLAVWLIANRLARDISALFVSILTLTERLVPAAKPQGKNQPMRNNMKNLTASVLVALAAIFAFASPAKAGFIDINGGTSWAGWNSVGNSQTSGIWVLGSLGQFNRTYDIYSTSFVLNAAQTASGFGNSSGDLFAGSWQAGDRIVGMGIKYTGGQRGNTFFFHTDTGAVNIKAASSYGASNGVFSHDVGDTSSYILGTTASNSWRVKQYSVFNGFTSNGGSNFITPYGTSYSSNMPTRSFAVVDGAGKSTSIQFLTNLDAILRSNGGSTFGEGGFGSTVRVGFREQDTAGGSSQQIFSVSVVPEPGASALLFAGLGSLVTRFRRRQES